ncbi:MAG: zinc ribbon domain-containing protein [Nitrospirae bacterium]|nr:zinc ribbon domain-containing protein [Nitrospirota bacterium]MDE3049489.1 zinc ribbon domain-containing protein [Nitrospirota bacterium]
MPIYEYRCGQCEKQFDVTQSVHVRPEDTVCPHCNAQSATRLMSACTTNIKGTHKTGFAEMKAYSMLDERMDKFSKLPPIMGKRIDPDAGPPPDPSPGGITGN